MDNYKLIKDVQAFQWNGTTQSLLVNLPPQDYPEFRIEINSNQASSTWINLTDVTKTKYQHAFDNQPISYEPSDDDLPFCDMYPGYYIVKNVTEHYYYCVDPQLFQLDYQKQAQDNYAISNLSKRDYLVDSYYQLVVKLIKQLDLNSKPNIGQLHTLAHQLIDDWFELLNQQVPPKAQYNWHVLLPDVKDDFYHKMDDFINRCLVSSMHTKFKNQYVTKWLDMAEHLHQVYPNSTQYQSFMESYANDRLEIGIQQRLLNTTLK